MTTRIETLRSLQKRIRDSKGADRELDRDVHEVLTGDCTHRETEYYRVQSDSGFTCKKCRKDMYGCREWPVYTASLDACEALHNAVLPGCRWDKRYDDFEIYGGSCFVRALPLATNRHTFLDAIVSAEISEMEAKESAT